MSPISSPSFRPVSSSASLAVRFPPSPVSPSFVTTPSLTHAPSLCSNTCSTPSSAPPVLSSLLVCPPSCTAPLPLPPILPLPFMSFPVLVVPFHRCPSFTSAVANLFPISPFPLPVRSLSVVRPTFLSFPPFPHSSFLLPLSPPFPLLSVLRAPSAKMGQVFGGVHQSVAELCMWGLTDSLMYCDMGRNGKFPV
ncbi:hypothetical protein B0H11DRAFT_1982938 [Mycena galericulata]|nr:hypothetical protein B0H11DRAFT_1982938 [Mycena galericulata]